MIATGVIVMALSFVYVFVTPLLAQVSLHRSDHSATAAAFLHMAKRNAVLAFVALTFQVVTIVLFIAFTLTATSDTLFLGQVGNLFATLDVWSGCRSSPRAR